MNINSNNSEMQLDYTLKDINIDSEVPKINISTKNKINMQTKSDINFNISNIVKIKPILEDLVITPSTEEQNFKSEKDGYDNVKVKAIESKGLVVTPSMEAQGFSGLYDTVNIYPIPDDYIIPEGEINITDNGTYDVTDKASAIVNIESSGSKYPIIEGEGEHEVRFVDYDGTLIKVQYVEDGGSATAPSLPTHDRLTFVEWNRTFTNITHDLDVGALYKPTSGNTELFINVTEETGLGITLNIYRAVSSGTIKVDWGDGSTSTFGTGTGAKALTHTYSLYGKYMISIITTVNYRLGGGSNSTEVIVGSNEDRNYGALIKAYCSTNAIYLNGYCCYNNYNLEEFTMISVTYTGSYSFSNTKQKAIIIPNTTTQINNRIGLYCNDLEYLIISNKPTSIAGPLTIGTKVKKYIFPESTWKPSSMTYLVYLDNVEMVWYAKRSGTYAIATAFAQYCSNLKKIPVYDNLTGITSTSAFYASAIEKIAIPPTVTSIANQVFYNCANLRDVYIYATTPPTLGGTTAFTGVNALCKIHVPAESLEAYQTATNWSTTSIKNKLVGDLEGEFKDGYCE